MNKFCPVCGGFLGPNEKIHVFCKSEAIENAKKIRCYIYEHNDVKANELVENLGIKREIIDYLLDEEILTYNETSSVFHKCKSCSKVIIEGDYCEVCKKNLLTSLNTQIGKSAVLTKRSIENKGVMYTQHLRTKK